VVFQTLNRLKWTGKLDGAEIVILHRGAPNDRKNIQGNNITEVKKGYFSFLSQGGETTIPHHRVREIRLDGKTIWKRN
jgi:uncharacterized protein (UPF0248 family)